MLNSITKKFRALLDGLKKAQPPEPLDTRFVDLAPTASADNAGIYFDALKSATTRDNVLNIALTGPYGSGKSSVIKTFLAQYPGHPLELSLASFLPDDADSKKLNTQEIERSILQQIVYGVDADKLPFSRFKRIKVPKRMISIGTSFLIMIGLVCAWYLFSKQAEVASGKFFDPFSWFNYFSVVAVGVFVWKVAHSAYTNSLRLSLKSISLKDVQIAPAAADQESILNRHLDEILYFFQSTDYDLVVIEDLDRFENPDIFVTLREINGLINANEGIKRRVRFLYALRDDIFANTDRTKFFEFIVPVVPVINHSNSVDKVIEHSQRIDLNEKLDKQFIREVSRYLSDLRLIQNIFNEYVVYAAKLTADDDGLLNENKLLAILIYKNVMPKDFAALHRQEGVLSQILSRCDQHVSEVEQEIRGEISAIKTSLAAGEQQELRDEAELRKVYAMAVVQRLPENFQHIITPDGDLRLGQLADDAVLEALIKKPKVSVSVQRGNYQPNRAPLDLSDLESSVDPTRSFEQRKAEIRTKSVKVRSVFEKRIHELETKISSLRTRRFNEVVRESATLIEKIFSEINEHRDLLRYLILEGHIDDTYYQYISLFHSGRLSPKDNSFLIKIRAYNVPDPDFHLDNVGEVIASMRSGDFGQAYVLNRFIVDHLFADAPKNAGRIADALKFIIADLKDCGEFFRSYYAAGIHVDKLVAALLARWPGFVSAAVEAPDGAAHIARILAYASDEVLLRPANKEALEPFLSDNTHRVLAEGVDFRLDRLGSLEIEIAAVEELAGHLDVLSFVAKHGLYRISIDNIRCIVGHVSGGQKMEILEKRHLSTLNELNDAALLMRIDSDFPTYMSDVLLALPTNTEEDLSAISQVLGHDDIEHHLRSEFLERQTAVFANLKDIPEAFQQVALASHHVDPTWDNCLQFLNSEAYDAEVLTTYLQTDQAVAALSQQAIPSGEPALVLQRFVLSNDAIGTDIYRSYIRRLPVRFSGFPDVDDSKKKVPIEERKVAFNPASFQSLEGSELRVQFISLNFDAYVAGKSEYPMDDEFRGKLFRTSFTDTHKLSVLADMDESYVASTPSVAAIVGSLLDRSPGAGPQYGVDFIKAIVLHSHDVGVQISLLNKMHPALTVPEVREVLQGLPMPFQDIAAFSKSPTLENNERNRQLAQWLNERNVVSSLSKPFFGEGIKINTFRKEPG